MGKEYKTKMYVMTHKPFKHPDLDGFFPLQVGSALHEDFGYIRDNTGDNISDLNPYYSELTGQYWLWKNEKQVQNIGCCHYRRYFINENKDFLSIREIENMLAHTDIVVARLEDPRTWRELYGAGHNIKDLYSLGEVIKEKEPESYDVFEMLLDSHTICFGNMYAMPKAIFDEYMEWLFGILAETGERIDISSYDNYEKRVFGLLAENMIQIFSLTRGYSMTTGRVSIIAEKSETTELKLALQQLLRENRLQEARQLYDQYCSYRKDVLFSQSDISGELAQLASQIKRDTGY